MGIYRWGKAAAGVLLVAAAMAAMSGCAEETDTAATKKETPPSPSPTVSWRSATMQDAARMFQEDFQELTSVGCSTDCGPELVNLFNDARLLTELMQESGAPEGTYDKPIRVFTKLEKGFTTAAKLSGKARLPPMLGPAHELNDWLETNPNAVPNDQHH
ncbi:hypothetical protein [Streptomyces sp. NPDC048590]|uniref:hypothetical protein n=1 Tax=Streptomyces sp. NPDC048590 TaxID=3365574 RepID=UPI003724A3EA